jgi:hypothetical protein
VPAAPPVHRVPGMAPGLPPFRAKEGTASAPEAGSGCVVSAERKGSMLPPSTVMIVYRQGSGRRLHFPPVHSIQRDSQFFAGRSGFHRGEALRPRRFTASFKERGA